MRADRMLVQDMILAAGDIAEYVDGMTLSQFLQDGKTKAAVERKLITMGEAVSRLTRATKDANSDVPWQRLVKLRNFYVHGYERLGPEEVWATATRAVPRIEAQLHHIVFEPDGGPDDK